MTELAILGGRPMIPRPFPPYRSLGAAEEEAVQQVVRSGCLSGFYGSWESGFLGGSEVQAFEAEWKSRFKTGHAISVNSATSGLMAALGAIGIGPGDEIIVPATTMSATATACIVYGGIPVFADINPDTFCLDLDSVRENLSGKTKAILAVNLFGQAAPLSELRRIADERGIFLIEDNAQGPLATESGRYCGTIGHIGVFSLNYHKHIHTGEGGMCITDDPRLAQRLQMIRNHAEAVVEAAGVSDITNMFGFNFRLTELSAAIGRVQLAAIDEHVNRRERFATRLTANVANLEGIIPPPVRENCRHVYYVWALRCISEQLGIKRDTFIAAIAAEGVPCFPAYVRPLYLLPMFQRRIAMGPDGFPFNLSQRTYDKGLCPTAERLHAEEIVGFEPCAWQLDESDADLIGAAIRKVHAQRDKLRSRERNAA